MLDGFTALSLLAKINFLTLLLRQASTTLWVPSTLVLSTSKGLYSDNSTCFKAAQWKTTSTEENALKSLS